MIAPGYRSHCISEKLELLLWAVNPRSHRLRITSIQNSAQKQELEYTVNSYKRSRRFQAFSLYAQVRITRAYMTM